MNRRTSAAMILLIIIVAGGALAVGLSGTMSATAGCISRTQARAYSSVIQDGKPSHAAIHGRLCDTLTITNKDKIAREISFGPHDNHTPYDGIAERVLNAGESFTITLGQAGTYHWHDHLHEDVQGYFTVTK